MVKKGAQFYLLGPNIEDVRTGALENIRFEFIKTDFKTAVLSAMNSQTGGLYIPTEIPAVSLDELKNLCSVDYKERAKRILGLYLTDFTKEELLKLNKQLNKISKK